MNSVLRPQLDKLACREYGMLVLLDWMMRYDRLHAEKTAHEKSLRELEERVKSLKRGFFRSAEEEDALSDAKKECGEIEQFLVSLQHEMKMAETHRFHLTLSGKDEAALEPLLREMEQQGWLKLGDDDYFHVTVKGREVYEHLLKQQDSYLVHFEVFAYVDLEQGVFANPDKDLLEGDRWTDVRVAVAEYKGIDPYRVVFLSMLAEGVYYENPDWKFDLGMDVLFNDMENLVQEQLAVEELGYEDEQGLITGEEVIGDVIEQGGQIKHDKRRDDFESEDEELPDEQIISTTYYF